MRRLAEITTDFQATYNHSGNLNRETKKKQDRYLAEVREKLTSGTGMIELDDYEDLLNYGAAIGQVLFEVEAQRGFSKDLVYEMETLQSKGLALVQRWCDSEPLNLTEEDLEQKRVKWKGTTRKQTKRTRRNKDAEAPGRNEDDNKINMTASSAETPSLQRRRLESESPEI